MDLFFYEFKQSPERKAIKEPCGLGDNVRGIPVTEKRLQAGHIPESKNAEEV